MEQSPKKGGRIGIQQTGGRSSFEEDRGHVDRADGCLQVSLEVEKRELAVFFPQGPLFLCEIIDESTC